MSKANQVRFDKRLRSPHCYYDVAEKENFERIFGGLAIGANPTPNASRYFVLSLDFSRVGKSIGSDWNKLPTILAAQRHAETYDGVLPLTEQLAETDEVTFDLVDSFPIERIFDEKNFKSLYYYYGIVTMGSVRRRHIWFRVPNECVRRQIFEYMRSVYEKRPNAVDASEFSAKYDAFAWDGAWPKGRARTMSGIRQRVRCR